MDAMCGTVGSSFSQTASPQYCQYKNGVEAQNKHFKYDYLPRSVDKSVFGIAVLLVELFIPDA